MGAQADNDLVNRFPARFWRPDRLHEFRDLSKIPPLRPQLLDSGPPQLSGAAAPEYDALEAFLNDSGAEDVDALKAATGMSTSAVQELEKALHDYFKSGLSGADLYKKLSKIKSSDMASLKAMKPDLHSAIMTFLMEYGSEGMSDLNL